MKIDMRVLVTIVGLVLVSSLLPSCSAAESPRNGRVLAPGEPDVTLPDPASLPKPPAPTTSPDAGASPLP